jgi:LL-diaminopimelate aminotransferase
VSTTTTPAPSPRPSPIPLAARLAKLPPYLFAEIDKNKREARARGVDLIDMGIGDPDLPTPPHIIEAIKRSAETPANHRYPDYEGLLTFRTAVANWYRGRFGVTPRCSPSSGPRRAPPTCRSRS